MSGGERPGSSTGVWEHKECRKTEKRPYMYEEESSKFSFKKPAHSRYYSRHIYGQQNGNRERGGGQNVDGRGKLLPCYDGNVFYGNSRTFSEGHNYINKRDNFDKKGNKHFESMERNYNNIKYGKFGTVGDDSTSEEESSDSGTWSYQSNTDETLTFDYGQDHYWGQGGPWSLRGRAHNNLSSKISRWKFTKHVIVISDRGIVFEPFPGSHWEERKNNDTVETVLKDQPFYQKAWCLKTDGLMTGYNAIKSICALRIWSLKTGYKSAKRCYRERGIGHQEKSPSQMSLKEKIHEFGIFLQKNPANVNAIQTIEIGLARSRLYLMSKFHIDKSKTDSGKPNFTCFLTLNGVFVGRSCGWTKKEAKHNAYETALKNLKEKSVDEIFQLKDPGIEAERDKEVVSAKLETNHNTHVHISDADSVQARNNTVAKKRDKEVVSAKIKTNHKTTHVQISDADSVQAGSSTVAKKRDKELVSAKLETNHNTHVQISDADSVQAGNNTVAKKRDEEVVSTKLEANHNTHVHISDAESVQAGNNTVAKIKDKEVVSAKLETNHNTHVQISDADSVQAGSSTVAKKRDEEVVCVELDTYCNTHAQISEANSVLAGNCTVAEIRNEEVVSPESETNHNTHVQISADSVQAGNNNTQIINIPPGQPVSIDQRGNGNNVIVNLQVDRERRSSDSERGPGRYIDLRIQMSRQDGLTIIRAEDLENLGLEALRTEQGHQLVIRPIETALDGEMDSIFKGSVIIRLRPKNKDSISKLRAAIETEQLHKILASIVKLEKVKSAVSGSQLILNVTVCIPIEDFVEKNKREDSILIRLKSWSEDSYSRLKTKVETGHLQKILARISEIEPVKSALSGSDLVMNVTASVTEENERPSASEAGTCKGQDLVKLPENDSSNISLNTFPDITPCSFYNTEHNWLKCLHHKIETQPSSQLLSADKSFWKIHSAPFKDKCKPEPTIKRKPESESLRQLKSETEDKVDTVRRLGCILTTQAEEAKKLLMRKRSIVMKGNTGEGKTTTALQLIDNEIYRDRRVVLNYPRDWKKVDIDYVNIVVLEDILGQYDLDPGHLQEWMVYLPTIQEHVDAGQLQVIITTRIDILPKAYSMLGSIKLFNDDLSQTLSSEQLQNSEKMSILNRKLQRYERNMKENEKQKCIAKFNGLIGFPQCCSLFAGDSNLFDLGPKFFESPDKLLNVNITQLEDTRFLSLAFLFCNGAIYEEYLSPEIMPKSSKHLLIELASHLHISKSKASMTLLRDVYDNFSGFYIEKLISEEFSLGCVVKKHCVRLSHATVFEAVGQVLGDCCVEMIVKYCHSDYLYQRTYTAEAKDRTSQNIFIPVSVYELLAERMVHDVIEKGLVFSVVRHPALKQHQFLNELKNELHKGNRIKNFFIDSSCSELTRFPKDVSQGECFTFLQYILQSDEDVVKSVYSQFLEFLACTHNNDSTDCWQCEEKQKLLELSLYFHHFEIADKLITMNACYTYTSLCNAARHHDVRRVQTILETLKRKQVFNPQHDEARKALCTAYVSESLCMTKLFLQEGITLASRHVVDVVTQGDINALMKVVEHLKYHNNWNPHIELYRMGYYSDWDFLPPSVYLVKHRLHEFPFSIALYIAYCNEKFDMADYLVKNGVGELMHMIPAIVRYSSQQAAAKVLQTLKDTCTWNSNCNDATKALENAYSEQKYDLCDLLVQEGVMLTMKNLRGVICGVKTSFESVVKAIQHLKDINNWDPKCDDASEALENAYSEQKYDVCDLLFQEGVLLTMKNLPGVICGVKTSFESVVKAIQHLKDTDNWDPKCDDVSKALENAYCEQKYDVCDLLVQEGVLLTMKNLRGVICGVKTSFESFVKAIQHLKDTDNWDPKCDDASEAFEHAYSEQKYDMCNLLVQEGVSLTMKSLPAVIQGSKVSFHSVEKAIQHLKDTDNWNPKCADAFEALENAYCEQKYDVCDLLVQEGVPLTMKSLPAVIQGSKVSFKYVKKVIQYLKDTDNWDSKCDYASEALENTYCEQKYDVLCLLVQEGVSLTMKNLHGVICGVKTSFESVVKAIQHLKDTDNWDPKCDDASEALGNAYCEQKYDVCDLLVQEGVSLTMKSLPAVIQGSKVSFKYVKKAIQHLKDTDNWDSKCDYASEALVNAYCKQKYNVFDLLVQEGVLLTMKNLRGVICGVKTSFESVVKAIQHLKDTDNWDPKCDDASEALENAYCEQKYDVCDLLIHEGVSPTVKNLYDVIHGCKV